MSDKIKKFESGRKMIFPKDIPEITNDVVVYDVYGTNMNGIIDDDESHHKVFSKWWNTEINIESQAFLVDRTLGAFISLKHMDKKIDYTITLSRNQAQLLTMPNSGFGIFTTKGKMKFMFRSFIEDSIIDILKEKVMWDKIYNPYKKLGKN